MTVVTAPGVPASHLETPSLLSRMVTGLLGIKPLAAFAKSRARQMMIKRAAKIGLNWPETVAALQARDWSEDWQAVLNPDLTYPDYYECSFHAYEAGNLDWEPALEQEVAARTVHSTILGELQADGDEQLRSRYHAVLAQRWQRDRPDAPPRDVLDIGCGVGLSTFALQQLFPSAQLTGLDLSPYFLAVAHHNTSRPDCNPTQAQPRWVHAAGEATGLPAASFDLISVCLVYHELPQTAAREIVQEARRLLRPGGYLAIMDMNPQSQVYAQMPPYVLTLLKSTEPYLDQYFTLDLDGAIADAGFADLEVTTHTVRHRVLMARAV